MTGKGGVGLCGVAVEISSPAIEVSAVCGDTGSTVEDRYSVGDQNASERPGSLVAEPRPQKPHPEPYLPDRPLSRAVGRSDAPWMPVSRYIERFGVPFL